MTLTKFILLGSVIGGAVLLANKERRDRILVAAKDFIDSARRRLEAGNQPIDIGGGTGTNPPTSTPRP